MPKRPPPSTGVPEADARTGPCGRGVRRAAASDHILDQHSPRRRTARLGMDRLTRCRGPGCIPGSSTTRALVRNRPIVAVEGHLLSRTPRSVARRHPPACRFAFQHSVEQGPDRPVDHLRVRASQGGGAAAGPPGRGQVPLGGRAERQGGAKRLPGGLHERRPPRRRGPPRRGGRRPAAAPPKVHDHQSADHRRARLPGPGPTCCSRSSNHRYERGSTLITSNKEYPRMAGECWPATRSWPRPSWTACCHYCHMLQIDGRSFRLRDIEQQLAQR